ncbi:serpin family protein [Streptomyces sp. NBC_00841]|uniref:serpin family protein n=1 Tax=unclassified Streptomyces TaxID=2593676 RepID=UPI00225958E4|nr:MULTISPECIES: serpin family protein [unclassified Streptomyces]MCX4535362.1 serpin family protein [Streptomyces sp. NBC_01669]WRZ99338.1 serpin family protein [Streptomyces sp. NBC_00841]
MVAGTYVVELRCGGGLGGGAPARVRLVLGEPGRGAEALADAWAPARMRTAVVADEVRTAVPRFTLRTTVQITEQLPACGVRIATSARADFSGISQAPLRIARVVQEAVVTVGEEGVEAAAATVVVMATGLPREPLRVQKIDFDRPFGIVVLDADGEVPLFTGRQADFPRP